MTIMSLVGINSWPDADTALYFSLFPLEKCSIVLSWEAENTWLIIWFLSLILSGLVHTNPLVVIFTEPTFLQS